jgi:RNA polymerase sigma factor (sigma-70 family)
MPENENILLRRFAASGDAEAFAEIVRRHAGLVYAACLRVLADKDRAADAVQETFLQLLHNAETITGSVPMWLHRVATRKAIDVIRRDSSRRQREVTYAADKPRRANAWQDISRQVDEELDELDEQTRSILIQRFFEGLTTKDIAFRETISQPTVSRRIESGVRRLRDSLRKKGILISTAALFGLLGENVMQAAPAVVLKELGKIALVGSQAAAAAGAGAAATASGAGAQAAAGVLTGIKIKVVTAAAVAVVGVGSVVTYNEVTRPPKPVPSAGPTATSRYTGGSSARLPEPVAVQPAPRTTNATQSPDWSELDRTAWEQIFAEHKGGAPPAGPVPEPVDTPNEPSAEVPATGFAMASAGGEAPPADTPEEPIEAEPNEPPAGYGGMGGAFFGTSYETPQPPQPPEPAQPPPPPEPDSPEQG